MYISLNIILGNFISLFILHKKKEIFSDTRGGRGRNRFHGLEIPVIFILLFFFMGVRYTIFGEFLLKFHIYKYIEKRKFSSHSKLGNNINKIFLF